MPKYYGSKYYGHDATLFRIDTDTKDLFGVSVERFSRKKHDDATIESLLSEYVSPEEIKSIYHSFLFGNSLGIYFALILELIDKVYSVKYLKQRLEIIQNIKQSKLFTISFIFRSLGYSLFWRILYVRILNLSHFSSKLLPSKYQKIDIHPVDHHYTHALSAYYFSPFMGKNIDTIVFILDGAGDSNIYATLWHFSENNECKKISESCFPEGKSSYSIGVLYSIFTELLGFHPNADEGKTEALAAFGTPDNDLLSILMTAYVIDKNDLLWKFDEHYTEILSKDSLQGWLNKIGRESFAATIQTFLQETVVEYLNLVHKRYPTTQLALAGGVAANVIMNLHIYERTSFKDLYIFPAMGDDGTAAGAAILNALDNGEDLSWLKDKYMPYWGPQIDEKDILEAFNFSEWKDKILYEKIPESKLADVISDDIMNNKIVALVQGKMEFGPRALGHRSILANPRNPEIQNRINTTVKRRPSFQPFCPSVLEEERERLFEKSYPHKHMAIAFRMKKEFHMDIPGAIHVDGTARPQFVEERDDKLYYNILKQLKQKNEYGITINTSFNLHGRTIVRTAEDAIRDFIDCNIDTLFLEGYKITIRTP